MSGQIGRRAGDIVPKARVEPGRVQIVLESVVHRVPDGPSEQLLGEIHGEEPRIGVHAFVAGHRQSSTQDGTIASAPIHSKIHTTFFYILVRKRPNFDRR